MAMGLGMHSSSKRDVKGKEHGTYWLRDSFRPTLLFEPVDLPNALVLSLDPLSVLCQIPAFLHGTGRTEQGSYRARQLRCACHVEITFEGGNVVWRTPNLMH